jgi:hypothetical protein
VNARQALQRIEIQLAPRRPAPAAAGPLTPDLVAGSAAASTAGSAGPAGAAGNVQLDPIVSDPQGVYREQVAEALIDAMLDHSSGLRLEPTDWFTIAARGQEVVSRLSPADTESPTIQISVRGEDLLALLARQISRDEAKQRVIIKVF